MAAWSVLALRPSRSRPRTGRACSPPLDSRSRVQFKSSRHETTVYKPTPEAMAQRGFRSLQRPDYLRIMVKKGGSLSGSSEGTKPIRRNSYLYPHTVYPFVRSRLSVPSFGFSAARLWRLARFSAALSLRDISRCCRIDDDCLCPPITVPLFLLFRFDARCEMRSLRLKIRGRFPTYSSSRLLS
jgi:hypothetical protein